MYEAHEMTVVGRDRKTVVVHYEGMTEAVTVKAGRVVKQTAGAAQHCEHAIGEAARALGALGTGEVD
jgi:hypothetical protein